MKRWAVLLLILLVPGGIFLGVLLTSRSFWIGRIRKKWGATNPALRSDAEFDGKSLTDLRNMYRFGRPGWASPTNYSSLFT
jgi:hypothetical protein